MLDEQELLNGFKAVFKVCGLQKIVDAASKIADKEGLAFDPEQFASSLAYDCVEVVRNEVGSVSDSFSFLDTSATPQTLDETLHVLTYELGKVVYCHHYAKRYGPKGYETDMKAHTANMISMVRMVCEHKSWDFAELKQFGEDHYLERQDDLKKYGLKEQLK